MPLAFEHEMYHKNVKATAEIWVDIAQQELLTHATGFAEGTGLVDGRGRAALVKRTLGPKAERECAGTVRSRLMGRDLRRVHEVLCHVQKGEGFSVHCENTRKTFGQSWKYLSPGTQEQLAPLFELRREAQCYAAIEILTGQIKRNEEEEKVQRNQRKHRALRESATRFMKTPPGREKKYMTKADGSTTANVNEQLEMVVEAWKPIMQKLKKGEPAFRDFMQYFGNYMKTARQVCEPITGERVAAAIRAMHDSSAGADGWLRRELFVLQAWHPYLCDALARLLNLIEATGEWPEVWLLGIISLVPKDLTKEDPGPLDKRPIAVLSILYRTWSKIRGDDCMLWQEQWQLCLILSLH